MLVLVVMLAMSLIAGLMVVGRLATDVSSSKSSRCWAVSFRARYRLQRWP